MTDLHLGDVGSILRFTVLEGGVALDCSSGSAALKLRKKDKTIIERDMVFTTDGTDGKFEYITQEADIEGGKGKWNAQLFLVLPGWIGHTSKVDVEVADNVDT